MKKEVYSFQNLLESLKECDGIVAISGYNSENNKPINLQYYKGKFALNHGFNLCANFQLHKLSNASVKALFNKCGAMSFEVIDFSDSNKREIFNYNNFIRSFK